MYTAKCTRGNDNMNVLANKKEQDYINILKCIACLLILNSHCRDIYPFYFLAIGGGWGNSLFFILSGFCLININNSFGKWYKKRFLRILPTSAIIIVVDIIMSNALGKLNDLTIGVILWQYINKYWFIWAILIYYIFYYFIFREKLLNRALSSLLVHFVGYNILYYFVLNKSIFSVELEGFSWFKVYFYFSVFLAGGIIRLLFEKDFLIKDNKKHVSIFLSAVIVLSILLWTGIYGLISVFGIGLKFQNLIHAAVFIFAVAMLIFAYINKDHICVNNQKLHELITWVAKSTLEIYVVQIWLKEYLVNFVFPINWIMFLVCSIVIGVVLQETVDKFTKKKFNQ